ncbi:sensor histidine kinase [Bradyrhizobium sp. 15]|uniref:sensor histidine kinase n=1 Tax=Bradyrhizobium sp. 15 TaxID=2782633 RepID=UPI001FF93091|nr:sensor histidine kinase [Bradyrhizobium sp. 15]MCK1440756.1 sensor histidine kinase [Bradyrhizobium sp. 15]
MNFRVTARTILHLGSELISSDGVAFYELIKNSLDARSPEIRVDIVVRLPFDTYDLILREMGERRDPPDHAGARPRSWRDLRQLALEHIDDGAIEADHLRDELEAATTREQFVAAVRAANRIDVDDDGDGMSARTLRDVYLTIGTSYRARERLETGDDRRVILGEKGLGRLSAMRLGDGMEVITGTEGSGHWTVLEIDWNAFAKAADDDLHSIALRPATGAEKDRSVKGTLIRITALTAPWSHAKLEDLAKDTFARLIDPFASETLPLKLAFNGVSVSVPPFANFLLEQAHGVFTADYEVPQRGDPRLSGRMNYRLRNRRRTFAFQGAEVAEMAGEVSREQLKRIGPFSLEVHWFNRRLLTKLEGIGTLAQVRRMLAEWAGGVALYRDGYRVNPYAGPKDDWLDLDRDAFSTSGFKLNRGQIVGRARISKARNPYLMDQTNREGLTDSPEKAAFVRLLSATMEFFRGFLVEIDQELSRANRVGPRDALDRFRAEDARIEDILPELVEALSETSGGVQLSKQVKESLGSLRDAAAQVEAAAAAQEEERGRVMHLASIGLMIEVLAHELFRATSGGLKTIATARASRNPDSTGTSLRVLEAQLKTLQKRLKVLDPLSTNARQTKEEFDLVDWVKEIVESYASQNGRNRIVFRTTVVPRGSTRRIRAVKGMFVQIIENLLSNSVHWIIQQDKYDNGPRGDRTAGDTIGTVTVRIEPNDNRISVIDDGPGIPEDRREQVFQPFFTTKRQKEGRGLGLYIAREIAEYHGGTLTLGDADDDGMINTVTLELGGSDD